MEEQAFVHKSIFLYGTVGSLNIKPGDIYVGGTLDGGGHAYEVCRHLGNGRLVDIDQNANTITTVGKRLKHFKDKVTIIRSNYGNIKTVLEDLELSKVDDICLDLGVSSYQLDKASGRFIYREDTSLDMGMDQENTTAVTDTVSTCGGMELYRIIRDYSKGNFTRGITGHIVREREEHPVETMGQLAEIVKNATPVRIRAADGRPAKCTFQAIWIECNHGLDVLGHSINIMVDLLNLGNRLSIITFHSLGGWIVKNRFRINESPCIYPHEFLVYVCGRKSKGKVVSRKPVLPSEKGLEENSHLESAKLRVFERG